MNKLTPKQKSVLDEINRLIVVNDKKLKMKAALYAASENYLNNIKINSTKCN